MASLESTLGADSVRVRAGAGESGGARGFGLPRNARDAPITSCKNLDSVAAARAHAA